MGYLKCCNQAVVSDCVIAGDVVVRAIGFHVLLLPDLDLYIYREGVGGQDCGNAMINGFSEA